MPSTVPRTLPRSAAVGKYLPPPPVSAERYIADRLGITEGTAHQRLCGVRAVNREAAICYRGLLQDGGRERAEQWLLPVTIARRVALEPYALAAHQAAHRVDLKENAAALAYLTDDDLTAEDALRYVKAVEAEIAAKLAIIASIVDRHGLHRHMLELL